MYKELDIDDKVVKIFEEQEKKLTDIFSNIDKMESVE